MRKRSKYTPQPKKTFGLISQLMARPNEPSSPASQAAQLETVRVAFANLRDGKVANREDWGVCADCINVMQTLVRVGDIEDEGGWIAQASLELAIAARVHEEQGQELRLPEPGVAAFENLIEGFEAALGHLSERRMVEVHRLTEIFVRDLQSGRGVAGGVQVVTL